MDEHERHGFTKDWAWALSGRAGLGLSVLGCLVRLSWSAFMCVLGWRGEVYRGMGWDGMGRGILYICYGIA
jgi:hypothetical protein